MRTLTPLDGTVLTCRSLADSGRVPQEAEAGSGAHRTTQVQRVAIVQYEELEARWGGGSSLHVALCIVSLRVATAAVSESALR